MNTTSAVEKREKAVDYVSDDGIKQSISIKDDFSLSGYDDVDDYFENKIINNLYAKNGLQLLL